MRFIIHHTSFPALKPSSYFWAPKSPITIIPHATFTMISRTPFTHLLCAPADRVHVDCLEVNSQLEWVSQPSLSSKRSRSYEREGRRREETLAREAFPHVDTFRIESLHVLIKFTQIFDVPPSINPKPRWIFQMQRIFFLHKSRGITLDQGLGLGLEAPNRAK